MTARYLILEDGSVYRGESFGAPAVTTGELVFNTSMTGYQEIITDQIYHNQIVIFTQPNIGGSGINQANYESILPSIKGVIVRELANVSTNRIRRLSLDQYMKQMNIPGITGIDTRAVVRRLRQTGSTLKASIVPEPDEHAFDQLSATVLTNQQVAQVATSKPYPNPGIGSSVVVIDFGLKHGILRELSKRKCNVTVLPHTATAEDILRLDPDGVILSTGPGSPYDLGQSVIEMIQLVQTQIPLFGIGLGHELFAIANQAKVTSLPAEHHGMNHPIREIVTTHIIYASQGQGYAVESKSVDRSRLFITHIDLVNGTVQGLRHRNFPAFSVQFFPDGAPGPDETNGLFDEFMETMHSREG